MALVKLYAARDTLEAGFIRAWLEQRELKSVVFGENLPITCGEMSASMDMLPAVWVDEMDVDLAKALMEIYFEENKPENLPDPWQCPACEEMIEGQFDQCWHCGQNKPQ